MAKNRSVLGGLGLGLAPVTILFSLYREQFLFGNLTLQRRALPEALHC